jgi:hypothetical protein
MRAIENDMLIKLIHNLKRYCEQKYIIIMKKTLP